MATSRGCCVVAQQRSTGIIKSDEASSVEHRASTRLRSPEVQKGPRLVWLSAGNDSQGEGSIKR